MNRAMLVLRDAEVADAPALARLWAGVVRRGDVADQLADLESVIKTAAASAEQRLVVADYDGNLAGAVLLYATTITPINLEPTVQIISPHVAPEYRRRGIGRMLMDSAVSWAEQIGIGHLATGAAFNSREANRFLARMGLGPNATLRLAPTAVVRAKLDAQRPALVMPGGRHRSRVVAARRSMRRAQEQH